VEAPSLSAPTTEPPRPPTTMKRGAARPLHR
jgi:hypothetical protein